MDIRVWPYQSVTLRRIRRLPWRCMGQVTLASALAIGTAVVVPVSNVMAGPVANHRTAITGAQTVTVLWNGVSAGHQSGTAYLILSQDVTGLEDITIGGRSRSMYFENGVASIVVHTKPATTLSSTSSVNVVDLNQAPPQPRQPLSLVLANPLVQYLGALVLAQVRAQVRTTLQFAPQALGLPHAEARLIQLVEQAAKRAAKRRAELTTADETGQISTDAVAQGETASVSDEFPNSFVMSPSTGDLPDSIVRVSPTGTAVLYQQTGGELIDTSGASEGVVFGKVAVPDGLTDAPSGQASLAQAEGLVAPSGAADTSNLVGEASQNSAALEHTVTDMSAVGDGLAVGVGVMDIVQGFQTPSLVARDTLIGQGLGTITSVFVTPDLLDIGAMFGGLCGDGPGALLGGLIGWGVGTFVVPAVFQAGGEWMGGGASDFPAQFLADLEAPFATVYAPDLFLHNRTRDPVTLVIAIRGSGVYDVRPAWVHDSWEIVARPGRSLLVNGHATSYLHYETTVAAPWQTTTGWVVSRQDFAQWAERTLVAYGFDAAAREVFLQRWQSLGKGIGFLAIYPQPTATIDRVAPLAMLRGNVPVMRVWFLIEASGPGMHLRAPLVAHSTAPVQLQEWGVISLPSESLGRA